MNGPWSYIYFNSFIDDNLGESRVILLDMLDIQFSWHNQAAKLVCNKQQQKICCKIQSILTPTNNQSGFIEERIEPADENLKVQDRSSPSYIPSGIDFKTLDF